MQNRLIAINRRRCAADRATGAGLKNRFYRVYIRHPRLLGRPDGKLTELVLLLSLCVGGLCFSAPAQEKYPTKWNEAIARRPEVAAALWYLDQHRDEQLQQWITITEIPAPSRMEQKRAAYLRQEMEKAGLAEIQQDEIGNLWGVRKGTGGGPALVFAAHMDTVHPADTPIRVRREGNWLHAPGVFDNSASLANMLAAARAMQAAGLQTKADVIFLATVQEELGLRGMRYWLERHRDRTGILIGLDGNLGDIHYGALGIRWTRYKYSGPGAHTMSSRGRPSPARAVSRAILNVYSIPLPPPDAEPTFIYNVGMLGGGKIFNSAPEEAYFTVDLRSTDPQTLERVDRQITALAEAAAQQENVKLEIERVQDNQAGGTRASLEPRRRHPLVQTAMDILDYLGVGKLQGRGRRARAIPSGSTDANVGVELGLPAVSTGRSFGRDQHTLREASEIDSAYLGTKQIVLLAAALDEL